MTANKLWRGSYVKRIVDTHINRHFSCSAKVQVKRVEVSTENKVTTVEGKYLEDNNKRLHIKGKGDYCPTCPRKLGFSVQYTDVLIISQFVKPDGSLLPMSVTGMCRTAQQRMKENLYKAQKAGLIPGYIEPVPDPKDIHGIPAMRSIFNGKRLNIYFNQGTKLPFKV